MENLILDEQGLETLLIRVGFINESNNDEPNSNTWLRYPRNSTLKGLEHRILVRENNNGLSIEIRQIVPGYPAYRDVLFPNKEVVVGYNINTPSDLMVFFAEMGWNIYRNQ